MHHAVVTAFEGLIKADTYPGYFLYLEVDPKSIDINIHPTKTEVKFDDEHTMYAILRSAVKHSLGQFSVAPVLDFERDSNLDTPYAFENKEAILPKVTVDSSFNPFDTTIAKGKGVSTYQKQSAKGWENLYEGLDAMNPRQDFSSFEIESESEIQSSLYDEEDLSQETGVTFQLQRKYIVSTVKSGLLVIHQNRAHQRVLFEKFLGEITVEKGLGQQLLFPLELNFTAQERAILNEIQDSLLRVGFLFENLEDETIKVTAVPSMVSESKIGTVLDLLISEYKEGFRNKAMSQAELLAQGLAKNLAIKSGEILNEESQMALLHDLFACKEPALSPNLKKIYTIVSEGDLEKKLL